MPLTICDNMVPFMFPYLKWFGRRQRTKRHAEAVTESILKRPLSVCLFVPKNKYLPANQFEIQTHFWNPQANADVLKPFWC